MNKTKAVVQCGALAFLLCGLFPPWLCTFVPYGTDTAVPGAEDAGFSFIFIAPSDRHGVRIDAVRLGVEWLCVLAATGAAWVLVAKPGQDETKR